MQDYTQNTASRAHKITPALHFVATPIGAARDVTLRALDILAGADVLAAEDTRALRHLMEIHGIPLLGRNIFTYHEHNEAQALPRLIAALEDGKSVAYASEAGTPLISDPGFGLARAAIDRGLEVLAAPGASAVLCALTVSGLPSDRFYFAGFPPNQTVARQRFFENLAAVDATVILYESPKRIEKSLADMIQCFGPMRRAALCRELTKRFEEVIRGSLQSVADRLAAAPIRGEIVMLIDRAAPQKADQTTIEAALDVARATMSVKDAAGHVALALNLPRRDIYQLALKRDADESDSR